MADSETEPAGAPPVEVRILRPDPALADHVDLYYIVDANRAVRDRYLASPGNIRLGRGEWVMTDEGVHIPTPQQTALFGPTDRSCEFGPTGAGVMIGAGLSPLGWASLFDTPAADLANRVEELADHAGREAADLLFRTVVFDRPDDAGVARAFDKWILDRIAARPPADPRIARIHQVLLGVPDDVAVFAREAGVSERTLHRLCTRAFGFAPKALLRQKRFQRTLERVRAVLDRPLTGLIDDGYYDQAHFNRDFRQYMGMTPTEYFNSPREIMRRAGEARRALNAPGIQGLHPPASRRS